jgi:hypothetical protein
MKPDILTETPTKLTPLYTAITYCFGTNRYLVAGHLIYSQMRKSPIIDYYTRIWVILNYRVMR